MLQAQLALGKVGGGAGLKAVAIAPCADARRVAGAVLELVGRVVYADVQHQREHVYAQAFVLYALAQLVGEGRHGGGGGVVCHCCRWGLNLQFAKVV